MKTVIITGASRGLGAALSKHLMEKLGSLHLISIARNANRDLKAIARQKRVKLDFIKADMAQTDTLEALMEKVFACIDVEKVTGLYLVNNAGIVEPITPLAKMRTSDLEKNLAINLTAPMVLTAAFMHLSRRLRVEKRVVTITSGASKRAVYGWSAYCSAKAGVNLFTACAAEEEKDKEFGVQLIAFSPGVMDTDMQATIRSSSQEDFKQLEDFVNFKKEGTLRPPAFVAEKLAEVLFTDHFPSGEFVDIKQLL